MEHSPVDADLVLVLRSTKLRRDYMQEPSENRCCSLLMFEVREINIIVSFEICHRGPRKILPTKGQDCQLNFAWYCIKGTQAAAINNLQQLSLVDCAMQ